VVSIIRREGVPVLAKFRVNDRHHVSGYPHFASQFWQDHPEWYIGHREGDAATTPVFTGHPSIGPNMLNNIVQDRPRLLDYAVPEVREKRLAIFREVVERYDVAGATLNFLREPFCVSVPDQHAGYLTDFVRQCRQVLDETLGAKGIHAPVLGALLPWDIAFCRAMGMEIDAWIAEGLLDYVAPSEGWVTDFTADIQPWVACAANTRCAVYPSIIGYIAYLRGNPAPTFCLPAEYENAQHYTDIANILPEHVRALAHRFYAEGADGLSSFNLYSDPYAYLFPLSSLCDPQRLNAGERRYTYLKDGPYGQWELLQLRLGPEGRETRSLCCQLHEHLNGAQACLRFKARGVGDAVDLAVSINDRMIAPDQLTRVPHDGTGFLYLQCVLEAADLRDGENVIAFSLRREMPAEVMIQEIDIRVAPH